MGHHESRGLKWSPEKDRKLLRRRRAMVAKLERAMAEQGLKKRPLAELMGCGRKWVDRLLDPYDVAVSYAMVWRAGQVLGVDLLGDP